MCWGRRPAHITCVQKWRFIGDLNWTVPWLVNGNGRDQKDLLLGPLQGVAMEHLGTWNPNLCSVPSPLSAACPTLAQNHSRDGGSWSAVNRPPPSPTKSKSRHLKTVFVTGGFFFCLEAFYGRSYVYFSWGCWHVPHFLILHTHSPWWTVHPVLSQLINADAVLEITQLLQQWLRLLSLFMFSEVLFIFLTSFLAAWGRKLIIHAHIHS